MSSTKTDNDKLKGYVILPTTFVVSAFTMGLLDLLATSARKANNARLAKTNK